jgi:hypothetical protein
VLWTGIDLFMGFVIGPILRKVDMSVRVLSADCRRSSSSPVVGIEKAWRDHLESVVADPGTFLNLTYS